jgi:phosphatidate cytidylyltransferase
LRAQRSNLPPETRPPRRWTDLRKRVASALALAVPALVLIWYGGIIFDLAVGAVTVALWLEWASLCHRGGNPALLVAGLAWMAIAAAALVSLRADPEAGRANVMFVVLLVWATDIGAYLTGRALQGARLAPRISPGKTWSGAAGGLLAAIAIGMIVAPIGGRPSGFPTAAATAAFLSVIGQSGDLLESLAKRRFGVKDSGHLIPGHGGALDRLDALLAVLPVAWLLAHLAGHGVVMWT